MGVSARTVVKIVVKTPPTGGRHSQQAAARRRDGMDQPGCSRPSPESARSEGLVGTSRTTATGSSVTGAGGIPESVTPVTDLLRDPGGKEEKLKSGSSVLALSPLAKTRTRQSQA